MSSLHTAGAPATQSASVNGDGRTRRSERSKRKIISAALSLIAEGREVTMVAVARRADLCTRSVFQNFRTVEGLYSAVRVKILFELIDGLVVIQELQGRNLEACAFNAVEELRRVFLPNVQRMRLVNWVFNPMFRADLSTGDADAQAEEQFNDKMQSIVSMLLIDEKHHFGQSDGVAYVALRSILVAQLHPEVFVPFLATKASFVAFNHMLVGTIREFLRALTKPA